MTKQKKPAFDIDSLDKGVKPGDDFDSFANGGWKKKNSVPDTESSWGVFQVLNKENEEVKIKGLIDDLLKKKGWEKGSKEQQLSDMYRSYMDITEIEKLGISPVKDLLVKVKNIKNLQDWINLHAEILREGVNGPIRGYVHVDDKDSSMNSVRWTQGGLTLGEKSLYEKQDKGSKKIRDELVKHIDKMFELFDLGVRDAGGKILDFETELAKMHKTMVELRDPVKSYNPTDLASIQKECKKLDFAEFAKLSGLTDKVLVLQDLKYLPNLEDLLLRTDLEVLKTYTKWQIMTKWASLLTKEIKTENFRFFKTVMHGTKEQQPREIMAIRAVDELGGDGKTNILGKLYAEKYFSEEDKEKVSEMIENVRSVYKDRINSLAWMSDKTKLMAQKKLAKFSYKIGYPDSWENTTSINISPKTLVANSRDQYKWLWNKQLKDIGQKADKSRWEMSPQTINAYFMPPNNEIVFPAAILQTPFYSSDADDAINYGSIMAVIGHEFTHGFDDEGSQYDEDGNLKVWWTEDDRQKFDKIAKSYSKYFSKFKPLSDTPINGDLTLGENIADLGGITLAYYALEKSIKENGDPSLIDGFTWQQRFFLGWAQVWQNNIKDEALRNRLLTDPHSPARFRILGPLPHFNPFYEAFDVKKGDAMYIDPEERIVIW